MSVRPHELGHYGTSCFKSGGERFPSTNKTLISPPPPPVVEFVPTPQPLGATLGNSAAALKSKADRFPNNKHDEAAAPEQYLPKGMAESIQTCPVKMDRPCAPRFKDPVSASASPVRSASRGSKEGASSSEPTLGGMAEECRKSTRGTACFKGPGHNDADFDRSASSLSTTRDEFYVPKGMGHVDLTDPRHVLHKNSVGSAPAKKKAGRASVKTIATEDFHEDPRSLAAQVKNSRKRGIVQSSTTRFQHHLTGNEVVVRAAQNADFYVPPGMGTVADKKRPSLAFLSSSHMTKSSATKRKTKAAATASSTASSNHAEDDSSYPVPGIAESIAKSDFGRSLLKSSAPRFPEQDPQHGSASMRAVGDSAPAAEPADPRTIGSGKGPYSRVASAAFRSTSPRFERGRGGSSTATSLNGQQPDEAYYPPSFVDEILKR